MRQEAAMATVSRVGIGTEMPDITLPTLSGEPVALSQFLGRKVVLFMWASW
jgi:peroxiredoxin